MKALKDLFLQELEDMYDSEKRIVKALPDLIEATTCSELKSALEAHLQETEGHVEKLERVFEAVGAKPKATKCPAMVGILDEGDDLVSKNKKSPNLNAAIICAGQKVEHYEIATYGCLHSWAELMGNSEAADILNEILDEEKAADRTLNNLAAEKNEEAREEALDN
jgi:ferritin-like metal-binding protein YciE